MTLTIKQKKKFYKNQEEVKKVILKNARRKGHIIFGARSVNQQVPMYLEKPTEDWDIFSKTPKKTAKRVEKKLDKRFGGDFFSTEEAIHKGTYKVQNKVTLRNVADYSKPEGKVPFVKRKGVKYANLEFQKKQIKKSLDDPESKFRRNKDLESRQRIKLAEQEKEIDKIERMRNKQRKQLRFKKPFIKTKRIKFSVNPITDL